MDNFTQNMATMLAQARVTNAGRNVQNPMVSQIQGGINIQPGYGSWGDAFGKGMTDYLEKTVIEAEKQKYLEENDPVRMQKKAEQAFSTYQSMPENEQAKYDQWLNNTPEGLRLMAKMQKVAPHLFTKEPLPAGADGKPKELPPGASQEEKQVWRFMRVTPSFEQQKFNAMQTISPTDRAKLTLAGPLAQQAQGEHLTAEAALSRAKVPTEQAHAELLKAQTTAVPLQTQATLMNAEAAKEGAAAHTTQAKTAQMIAPSTIAMHLANAYYHRKMADMKGNMSPEEKAFLLQEWRMKGQRIGHILDNYEKENAKLSTNTIAATRKDELRFGNIIQSASQVKQEDPDHPVGRGLYKQGVNILMKKWNDWQDSVKTWNKGGLFGIRTGSAPELDPKWISGATMLLDGWAKNIGSKAELEEYLTAYDDIKRHYWKQLTGAKNVAEAREQIDREMESILKNALPQIRMQELMNTYQLPRGMREVKGGTR